jgi:hypothetical protein
MKPTANLPDVKTFSCPALVFFIGLGLMPFPVLAQFNNLAPDSAPPSPEEPVKFFSIGTLEEQPKLLPNALGQFYLNQGKLEEFVQGMKIAFKLRAEGK